MRAHILRRSAIVTNSTKTGCHAKGKAGDLGSGACPQVGGIGYVGCRVFIMSTVSTDIMMEL